jgi:hypothetical protein
MGTSIIGNSDTVSVLRGTVVIDAYNSEFMDWNDPDVVGSGKASVQDFLTSEDSVDRETTTEGLRLVSDDPALFNVMLPTDRILYNGIIYEVDAPIQVWKLFARVHHVEVYLKKVIG